MPQYDLGLLGAADEAVKYAIQGYRDAQSDKLKQMELEAKLKADSENKKRQAFEDRMKFHAEYNFVPENPDDIYSKTVIPQSEVEKNIDPATGLLKEGLIVQPAGILSKSDRQMADSNLEREYKTAMIESARRKPEMEKADIAYKNAQTRALNKKASGGEELNLLPGYDHDKSVPIEKGQISKLRKSVANKDSLVNTLNQVSDIVSKSDRVDLANPFSTTRQKLDNLLSDARLIYKSPEFAQLGVLTGPDLKILTDIIENPGSVKNLYNGQSAYVDRLNGVIKRASSNVDNQLSLNGFRPKNQNGLLTKPKQSKPKSVIQNGHTYILNEQTGEYE